MDKQLALKSHRTLATVLLALFLAFAAGCEQPSLGLGLMKGNSEIYEAYSAAWIDIVGLTGISQNQNLRDSSVLVAYVDVLDEFNSRIKSPGSFRFELYEFIARANEPRGRRLYSWDDIDMMSPQTNNKFWHDFMRAYKFELEMEFVPRPGSRFVLEVTFITPKGLRLQDTLELSYP